MDLELVTTSGYGKNGALTILQRSVRPQIVTTFQLPDIRAAWTVRGPLNAEDVSVALAHASTHKLARMHT